MIRRKEALKRVSIIAIVTLALTFNGLFLTGCDGQLGEFFPREEGDQSLKVASIEDTPAYGGEPYVIIGDNLPDFDPASLSEQAYEKYANLDEWGRCGTAEAVIGRELMPTDRRGSIGQIKPSGWHTVRYDHVEGKYLYNRCHLIGYQLAGENANAKNLITGTRYMNTEGMLPFEDMVADYVKETGHHVRYRITPIFKDCDLVARGVQMEGWSIEDKGKGICFNVFVHNVQPGVEIDYATGNSRLANEEKQETDKDQIHDYILNTSSKKFHRPSCSGVQKIKKKNMDTFRGSREEIMERGYEPCGLCRP